MATLDPDIIRERIATFPAYPDDALIDPHTVAGLLSCSVETIKRRVRDGTIPPPIALTPNTHRFRVGDIRAALTRLAPKLAQA
jgi:predicted DNA-binding transcriptional regulator AlpA